MHVKEIPLFRLNEIWKLSSHQLRLFPLQCILYTDSYVFLVSWINSACPFQYHSGCTLESDVFRWILLRMRDRATSKRLTASGSSFNFNIFAFFAPFLLLVCGFFWMRDTATLKRLAACGSSFNVNIFALCTPF